MKFYSFMKTLKQDQSYYFEPGQINKVTGIAYKVQ